MLRVSLIGALLMVPLGAGHAVASEHRTAPDWAVECLPRITDWVNAPPASSSFWEHESPYPGVYNQQCYYWSDGDARGLLTLTLSWVTDIVDPSDIEYRRDCSGAGEYTNESETRGVSGGIMSDTHRATVSWDGDADLPDPPNEARHAAAETLRDLEEIAAVCPAGDPGAVADGSNDALPAASASGDATGADAPGGGPSATVLAVGAVAVAAAAAAGVAVRRVRVRRRSLGDLLATEQIEQGMILGGLNPIKGSHLPPEAFEPPDSGD